MPMMNVFIRSSDFDRWLEALKDDKGKARISARLRSAMFGNFGDCQPVGEGVSEMRIHVGPGYRVYFVRQGATVYVLLAGGEQIDADEGYRSRSADGTRIEGD